MLERSGQMTNLTSQQIESLRLAHAYAGFGRGLTCRRLLEEAFPELDYIIHEGGDDDE